VEPARPSLHRNRLDRRAQSEPSRLKMFEDAHGNAAHHAQMNGCGVGRVAAQDRRDEEEQSTRPTEAGCDQRSSAFTYA